MLNKWRWRFDSGWLVAAIAPVIAILPTLNGDHVIDTADGVFHVHRIFAAATLMQNGDFYPRWIPWFHLGYGYPVLNFYAPLATHLGGLLGVVGISAPLAYSLVVALFWTVGSTGMYGLARRYLPPPAALLAAVLWSYAPSALQAVWNIGSIAQIAGSGILPWLFWAVTRAAEQPDRRHCGVLALAFGGLLLAHQPTTVLAALFIIPGAPFLCIWFARRQQQPLMPRLLCVGGGLALGAGVAMIFLLPMALEVSFIQITKVATNTADVLAASFLQPFQLFQQPTAPDMSDLNRRLPETIGLVNGLLAGLGLAALLWKRQWRLALVWGLAAAFVIYLVLDISTEFWVRVPLMSQLRFPGRALRIGTIFFALLGASSLLLLPRRWLGAAAASVSLMVMVAALPTLYPSRNLLDFSNLSAVDFINYELNTYSFGGTSYNEFKPLWGAGIPYDAPADIDEYREDPLRLRVYKPAPEVVVRQVNDNTFEASADQPHNLRFRQFYFPGWAATIDGVAVEVFPEAEFGLLTASVPAGSHTIVLSRPGTFVENIAPLLTLVSLLLVVGLVFKGEARPITAASTLRLSAQAAIVVSVAIVGFALFNRFYIQPQTLWFRQQSPLNEPAAMQTAVNQSFGDAYELLGYTLHQERVTPGEWLNITLYWRALRTLDRYYPPIVQLVSPAADDAWGATGDFYIGEAAVKHQPGTFISDDYKLRIYADAPPYIGRISVQLRDGQMDELLPLADGSTRLLLPAAVRVQGNGASVQKMLNYRLGEQVELWCASVKSDGDGLDVQLFWHALGALEAEGVQTFVHGIDRTGGLAGQGDGPLLDGQYHLADWLAGQNLVDQYYVPDGASIDHLEIGLFLANGTRLPVTQDGAAVANNVITLPVEERHCTP